MRNMTMNESNSQYGAPVDTYRAKFLGVEEKTHPEYGDGLEWKFEIIESQKTGRQYAGKLVSRTTSPSATPRNSCGRMLSQLTGGIKTGAAADVDSFVGRSYSVQVEENSTGNGTRVGAVMLLPVPETSWPSPDMASAAQTAPPSVQKPPPRKGPAPPPPADTPNYYNRKFWVAISATDSEDMLGSEICRKIQALELSEDVAVTMVDGDGVWKKATDYGLENPF